LISTVEGILSAKEANRVIVDVGGVGLEVFVPVRIVNDLGGIGERVRLFTHLHVREDNLALYGFLSEDEKAIFEALISVSGIGPKVALAILSVTGADELAGLISRGMSERLMAFPGIGKKTAERIVLELKDKLPEQLGKPAGEEPEEPFIEEDIYAEALVVLESLGIARQSAKRTLFSIGVDELGSDYSVEDVIKVALKRFAKKL